MSKSKTKKAKVDEAERNTCRICGTAIKPAKPPFDFCVPCGLSKMLGGKKGKP